MIKNKIRVSQYSSYRNKSEKKFENVAIINYHSIVILQNFNSVLKYNKIFFEFLDFNFKKQVKSSVNLLIISSKQKSF